MFLWSVVAVIIVILDQLTKFLVIENIGRTEIVNFLPGILEFVYVENTGAAFNILSGRIGFLSIISVAFTVAVIWYMLSKKPQNKLLRVALMLLSAGALGNAIDRILRGYVVDFIKTVFIDFPVFNVADIAITSGAVLLIIYLLFFDGKKE